MSKGSIIIKIELVFKTRFNDLPSINDETIAFKSELKSFEVTKNLDVAVALFTIVGKFIVKANENRYNALIEREREGKTLLKRDPDRIIASFLNDNIDKCIEEVKRVFELLRWRFKLSGGDHKGDLKSVVWSKDGERWNEISWFEISGIQGYSSPYDNVTNENLRRVIEDLISNESIIEPVYHKLIRESQDLVFSNPKSAYAIAVSALEVAVKSYLTARKPDTEWLLENIPSPDVLKIIRDYFPKIDSRFKLPELELNELKKIIYDRNKLIHRGVLNIDLQTTIERIDYINDIIHLVDAFNDKEWGFYHQSKNRFDPNSPRLIKRIP